MLRLHEPVLEEDDLDDDEDELEAQTPAFQEGSVQESIPQLWAKSLFGLRRSIDEIYTLCEHEAEPQSAAEVVELLQSVIPDFQELRRRFEAFDAAQKDGRTAPLAWEVKPPGVKSPGGEPRARSPTARISVGSTDNRPEEVGRSQSPTQDARQDTSDTRYHDQQVDGRLDRADIDHSDKFHRLVQETLESRVRSAEDREALREQVEARHREAASRKETQEQMRTAHARNHECSRSSPF